MLYGAQGGTFDKQDIARELDQQQSLLWLNDLSYVRTYCCQSPHKKGKIDK